MNFLVDILRQNENAKIIIGLPKIGGGEPRESIVAYATDNFNFSGTPIYNTPGVEASTLQTQWSAAYNELMSAAGAWSQQTGKSFPNLQIKTLHSTISTWMYTDKLKFTLNLKFFALQPSDDVRIPVRRLVHCAYPIFSESVPAILFAPNGYDFTEKNCLAIKIGKWFKTPPLFLLTDFRFSFSKETITNGTPLYAEGSASFESYRILSADEVASFITGTYSEATDKYKMGNPIVS